MEGDSFAFTGDPFELSGDDPLLSTPFISDIEITDPTLPLLTTTFEVDETVAPPGVPEPSSCVLLTVALFSLGVKRIRKQI